MNESELVAAEEAIQREAEAGPSNETKHARVRYGIYSMRNQPGRFVIRIRVPAGIITAEQLNVVADVVERHAGLGVAHLTTRQGIEIADVSSDQVGPIVRQIEAIGLTTRRTGGNVVRGVVCCPLAGVARDEVFDVTPYALAVDRYFHNASAFQLLPRKIKISFEGCPHDHVRTTVADIGICAALRDERRGFQICVGGGLGASPKQAQTLEDFTPVEALFMTIAAILAVFDAHGNRQSRARARLKWLLQDWGIERFREAVFAESSRIINTGQLPAIETISVTERPPCETFSVANTPVRASFAEWRAANVRPQRQDGFVAVFLRCSLGELRPSQLRRLASAVQNFSGGARLTIEQDILLRWVPEHALPRLYEFLAPEGLATCCAEQIMDITRCAGAEQCLSAITNSGAAARAIGAIVSNGLSRAPALRPLRIRISGCPNACSHHHAADIGLFGVSKRAHGRSVPHYAVLLGGDAAGHRFGQRVLDVPAYQLAQAVERLLQFYLGARDGEESFSHFVERIGPATLRGRVEDLTRVPPPEQGPEFYRDLDATSNFAVEAREGECHA